MKMNRMLEHVAAVLIAMVFVAVLGSCGSGAVTAPEPTSFPTMTVSPAVAEVYPDVPTTFTIGGGKPPYNIFFRQQHSATVEFQLERIDLHGGGKCRRRRHGR